MDREAMAVLEQMVEQVETGHWTTGTYHRLATATKGDSWCAVGMVRHFSASGSLSHRIIRALNATIPEDFAPPEYEAEFPSRHATDRVIIYNDKGPRSRKRTADWFRQAIRAASMQDPE